MWLKNNADKNDSGISNVTKLNMTEFLTAILVDNVRSQRSSGLTDNDIIELYEQAIEVATFKEELNKKATFVEIINLLLKKTKDSARKEQKDIDPKLAEYGHIVRSLVPRLNETLIEILSEEPFQGAGMIVTEGGNLRFSSDKIITSLTGFSLRLLGGSVEPEHKLNVTCRVDGIDANETIR